jgi:PKD domain
MLPPAQRLIHLEDGGYMRTLGAGRSGVIIAFISLGAALAFTAVTAPAGAVVARIAGHGYGIAPLPGVSPANMTGTHFIPGSVVARAGLASNRDEPPKGGGQLLYFGGPVMHRNTTHVIYWDPNKEFQSTTTGIIDSFFTNVAHDSGLASNVFAVDAQYTDASGHAAYNSTFGGPLVDEDPYPASGCSVPLEGDPGPPYTRCLMDEQLEEELSAFLASNELPTGPTQLYFLLLPHKVVTCFPEEECSNNVFCAYHSYIEPGAANEIIYADIPFSLADSGDAKGCQFDGNAGIQQPNPDNESGENKQTRFADVALKYISHEYSEAITDPLVGEETAWVDNSVFHQENGDKCNATPNKAGETGLGIDAKAFLPTLGGSALADDLFNQAINAGHYYLQSEWDNAAEACLMKPLALTEVAIGVGAATAGLPVSFTSSAADPYGAYEPSWDFGDGGTATGPSPSHTYATAGEYTVTMTPKDALTGSAASAIVTTVTVASPPPPAGPVAPPVATTSLSATSTVGTTQPIPPNSAFVAQAGSLNSATGAITLKATFSDPGTLSWGATFANGKFGAFASSAKCKKGQLRLRGRCLPATIVFAKGSRALAAAGSVAITLKPSSSALKALKAALKQRKGVPVSVVLSFQSSRGGAPVSHVQTVTVKLKR